MEILFINTSHKVVKTKHLICSSLLKILLYFGKPQLTCSISTHTHSHISLLSAGPGTWAEGFPVANGPRQSPIDIIPTQTQFDHSLKPLKLKYDPSNSKGILNNGHSFQVDFVDDGDTSSKGPLPFFDTFKHQHLFHCSYNC